MWLSLCGGCLSVAVSLLLSLCCCFSAAVSLWLSLSCCFSVAASLWLLLCGCLSDFCRRCFLRDYLTDLSPRKAKKWVNRFVSLFLRSSYTIPHSVRVTVYTRLTCTSCDTRLIFSPKNATLVREIAVGIITSQQPSLFLFVTSPRQYKS